jgi:hypothetical protein
VELLATPLPNPAVVFREELDGWAVLVNLDTAASLALNPTGIVVWKLVDGKLSVQDIVASVGCHFRDVPDTMPDDVIALLDTLAEDGFIGHELSDFNSAPPKTATPLRMKEPHEPTQTLPGKLRRLLWRRGR